MPGLSTSRSSKRSKIYFAFPDRMYHYECRNCDALCCKGHGIGTASKETAGLLARYPELAWSATKTAKEGSDFTNPIGGCFFLTANNLCQIERDHGKQAKPAVCTLFPFNDFSRIGDYLIVSPHFLCPLLLRPGEGMGRHDELTNLLQETGIRPRALQNSGREISQHRALEVISREEAFRDRCGEGIGRIAFEDFIESESLEKGAFGKWRTRALDLWGISTATNERNYLDDFLFALAPPLRVRMLHLSEQQRLRVLSLASAYIRTMARITSRPISLQGSHQMISNVFGVLRLFSYGNISLRLKHSDVNEGVGFQNPELTLAFYRVIEEIQSGKKLFDAIEMAMPSCLPNIERAIFFHQLARKIRLLNLRMRKEA
jgi:hypothetical protein